MPPFFNAQTCTYTCRLHLMYITPRPSMYCPWMPPLAIPCVKVYIHGCHTRPSKYRPWMPPLAIPCVKVSMDAIHGHPCTVHGCPHDTVHSLILLSKYQYNYIMINNCVIACIIIMNMIQNAQDYTFSLIIAAFVYYVHRTNIANKIRNAPSSYVV